MRSLLYCIHFAIWITILSGLLAIVWCLCAPFDRRRHLKLLHRLTGTWAFNVSLINRLWDCRIENADRLDPEQTYVFVANHQSLADILVLYGLRRHFKWVAKDYLFKVPVLGPVMALNSYVRMPKSAASIRRMMARCRQLLDEGVSLFVFPEGTRSVDGKLGHFYDGAFKLAVEGNVPIVPIAIDGTHNILPKGSLRFNFGHPIIVRVLAPVAPADFEFDTRRLNNHVQSIVRNELARMRGSEKTTAVSDVPMEATSRKAS